MDEAPIRVTVEEIRKLINIENYIGEPIETEDKILIPVTKATMGFGVGAQKNENEMSGTGAGISVEPVTMVVVTKGQSGAEGIRSINLSKGSEANKALNELGLIITDIVKDIIPSKSKKDEYINVDDVTEVEIKDGEIKEKVEDAIDDLEEEIDIKIDDE